MRAEARNVASRALSSSEVIFILSEREEAARVPSDVHSLARKVSGIGLEGKSRIAWKPAGRFACGGHRAASPSSYIRRKGRPKHTKIWFDAVFELTTNTFVFANQEQIRAAAEAECIQLHRCLCVSDADFG
jgi:hypothetical protein